MKAKLFYKIGVVSYTEIPYGEKYWKILGERPQIQAFSSYDYTTKSEIPQIKTHEFMFNRFGKFNKEIIGIYVEI